MYVVPHKGEQSMLWPNWPKKKWRIWVENGQFSYNMLCKPHVPLLCPTASLITWGRWLTWPYQIWIEFSQSNMAQWGRNQELTSLAGMSREWSEDVCSDLVTFRSKVELSVIVLWKFVISQLQILGYYVRQRSGFANDQSRSHYHSEEI